MLDEPLNGLDPLARAETIALFRTLAADGMHVIISSHILHEVDLISDQVILLTNGYVVAEGKIHGVRTEMQEHPMQILIRCDSRVKWLANLREGLRRGGADPPRRQRAAGANAGCRPVLPELNHLAMNNVGIESSRLRTIT